MGFLRKKIQVDLETRRRKKWDYFHEKNIAFTKNFLEILFYDKNQIDKKIAWGLGLDGEFLSIHSRFVC